MYFIKLTYRENVRFEFMLIHCFNWWLMNHFFSNWKLTDFFCLCNFYEKILLALSQVLSRHLTCLLTVYHLFWQFQSICLTPTHQHMQCQMLLYHLSTIQILWLARWSLFLLRAPNLSWWDGQAVLRRYPHRHIHDPSTRALALPFCRAAVVTASTRFQLELSSCGRELPMLWKFLEQVFDSLRNLEKVCLER